MRLQTQIEPVFPLNENSAAEETACRNLPGLL